MGFHLNLDVQVQGGRRILDVDGQGRRWGGRVGPENCWKNLTVFIDVICVSLLNYKKAKYESHESLLTKCRKEKVILQGLSIYTDTYLHRSIWNQDNEFIETWHGRLQSFSLTLISDVMKFCDKTTENVSEEIEKTKIELNQQLNDNEREEIISTLQKKDELNKKKKKI